MKKLAAFILTMFIIVSCAPAGGGGNEADMATSVAATVAALNIQQEEEPNEADMATSVAATVAALNIQQEEEPIEEPVATQKALTEEELSNVSFFKDEVTNDLWLSSNDITYNLSPVIVRSGGPGNDLQMAMVDDYHGDDWIFIHSVVMNTGENVYRFELCEEGREVLDNGKIRESVVICLGPEDADKVSDITSTATVLMRYDGQDGRKDLTMAVNTKKALKIMFQLYMNLLEGTIGIDESMPAGYNDAGKQWWIMN